jgi:N-acetylmuramoyl-L-alanine amidase
VETIGRGRRGEPVNDIQARLVALGFHIEGPEIEADGFGPSTESAVRIFQQERGLLVDGVVGAVTWQELVEAGYALGDRVLYLRNPSFRGDDVRTLQRRLNLLGFDPGREDGILGEQTAEAVREFQRNVGLRADAIVGTTTLQALDRLIRAPSKGPGRTAVRENESLRGAGSLGGRTVAIDPGHGAEDPGESGPSGVREVEVTLELAELLAGELRERGAEPILLRSAGEDPPPSERAARANAAGADVLVSLHLNSHSDPGAEGSSSYYFGRLGSTSVAGHTLAELIQEEVTAATGLRDGRTHPKSFGLLRETRMPAVHVEPAFITNPKEERLLFEDPFRRELIRAIANALERYFAGRAASGPVEVSGGA